MPPWIHPVDDTGSSAVLDVAFASGNTVFAAATSGAAPFGAAVGIVPFDFVAAVPSAAAAAFGSASAVVAGSFGVGLTVGDSVGGFDGAIVVVGVY